VPSNSSSLYPAIPVSKSPWLFYPSRTAADHDSPSFGQLRACFLEIVAGYQSSHDKERRDAHFVTSRIVIHGDVSRCCFLFVAPSVGPGLPSPFNQYPSQLDKQQLRMKDDVP
jgi:hypothetical protein